MDAIASESVVFVRGEQREVGVIAIGRPYQVDDRQASCELTVGSETRRNHGASPLQALLLALQDAGFRLHDLQRKGWRLRHPDGEPFVAKTFFGPLLRAAPRPAKKRRR